MIKNGILNLDESQKTENNLTSQIHKKSKDIETLKTGLIGFDWTNPFFKGSFAVAFSKNINSFKHEFTKNVLSNENKLDCVFYIGKHNSSLNSLKHNLENLSIPVAVFQMENKKVENNSSKIGHIKIMEKAILALLKETKENKNVLLIIDDLELLHQYYLSILNEEGHQVKQ